MFHSHLQSMDAKASELTIPDFEPGLDWFNSAPLSFQRELRGKVVVLDFWTYCCINCMHVLPDLAELEQRYAQQPVAFIGVHTPKFANERVSNHIRQAILRYEIAHPVVNDSHMTLWRHLGIRSWPTIVIVGPKGNLLGSLSGEGQKHNVDQFIQETLNYYEASLFNASPLPIKKEREQKPIDSPLSFPGKLAIDPINSRLFISDSNHHRIVVTTLTGEGLETIGSGIPGFREGTFETAQFHRLQGLAYDQDILYVADAENHALRKVDFKEKIVSTLAGDGTQGRDYQGGAKGLQQLLSTPWDVALAPKKNSLFIAMAGTHQIWIYDMETQRAHVFSGTGEEENRNSDYLEGAAWSQPSGLSLGEEKLFVADSESSSVRMIDLIHQFTRTLAGGDPHAPQNLFAFGDRDGIGGAARLQHPLGVQWIPKLRQLAVADTYNHRIKLLDPVTGKIHAWVGSGQAGYRDGIGLDTQFFEPSGFALAPEGDRLYVADTNNHLVRVIDIATGQVSTVKIRLNAIDFLFKPPSDRTIHLSPLTLPTKGGKIILAIDLPSGSHFMKDPGQWKITRIGQGVIPEQLMGFLNDRGEAIIPIHLEQQSSSIQVALTLYYCSDDPAHAACYRQELLFDIPLQAEVSSPEEVTIHHSLEVY
jgi:DNA-binding beta-propeller fold protein YncE